jgi:putative ABC transport system permease protein
VTAVGFVLARPRAGARVPRRLFLLTVSVAIGVAALVAINSFTDNLRRSVGEQARALLGADLSFASRRPLPASVEAIVDTLARDGAKSPGSPASAGWPTCRAPRAPGWCRWRGRRPVPLLR